MAEPNYTRETFYKYGIPAGSVIVAVVSCLSGMYSVQVSKQKIAIAIAEDRASTKRETADRIAVLEKGLEFNAGEHAEFRKTFKELDDKYYATLLQILGEIRNVGNAPRGQEFQNGKPIK